MAAGDVPCTITVVDGAGEPVAGALVTVVGADRPVPELAYETDSAGTLVLRLPPGRARLAVDGGGGRAEASLLVAEGQARCEVEVRLEPSSGG